MSARSAVLEVRSAAFTDGSEVPPQYACDGSDISPPLTWSRPPPGTKSQSLIMDDPDAPMGVFTHWVLFSIPAGVTSLREDLPKTETVPGVGLQGSNDFGGVGYGGPCPPWGKLHHYAFTVRALDTEPSLAAGCRKEELVRAMKGHVIAEGKLTGTYKR